MFTYGLKYKIDQFLLINKSINQAKCITKQSNIKYVRIKYDDDKEFNYKKD